MDLNVTFANITAKTLKGKSKPQLESIIMQGVAQASQFENSMQRMKMQHDKQIEEIRENLSVLAEAKNLMNMRFNMVNNVLSSGLETGDTVETIAENLITYCRKDYLEAQEEAKAELDKLEAVNETES